MVYLFSLRVNSNVDIQHVEHIMYDTESNVNTCDMLIQDIKTPKEEQKASFFNFSKWLQEAAKVTNYVSELVSDAKTKAVKTIKVHIARHCDFNPDFNPFIGYEPCPEELDPSDIDDTTTNFDLGEELGKKLKKEIEKELGEDQKEELEKDLGEDQKEESEKRSSSRT
jgi:uncharacterized membrane protein